MFGKNLKYYRLKNNMTMKELADKIGVTNMAISNYENGKRTPDMHTLNKLADALNIKVTDFMAIRDENLNFFHREFRKTTTLTKNKQELIYESIEEYFNRFFVVVNLLGINVLQKPPKLHSITLVEDIEICARRLREWLNLSVEGPIVNLFNILENNGILVHQLEFDDHGFSGLNGMVNGFPYVVINERMTAERQRFTIAYELAHMAFIWTDNLDENKKERIANGIAGAFLFPAKDAVRELGIKRAGIKGDMLVPAVEFGVSMQCLAYRAKELQIINEYAYRKFNIKVSKLGWRREEPSRMRKETSNLFKQLVYRTIEEEEISIQRGAELLNLTYKQISDDLNQFDDKE